MRAICSRARRRRCSSLGVLVGCAVPSPPTCGKVGGAPRFAASPSFTCNSRRILIPDAHAPSPTLLLERHWHRPSGSSSSRRPRACICPPRQQPRPAPHRQFLFLISLAKVFIIKCHEQGLGPQSPNDLRVPFRVESNTASYDASVLGNFLSPQISQGRLVDRTPTAKFLHKCRWAHRIRRSGNLTKAVRFSRRVLAFGSSGKGPASAWGRERRKSDATSRRTQVNKEFYDA